MAITDHTVIIEVIATAVTGVITAVGVIAATTNMNRLYVGGGVYAAGAGCVTRPFSCARQV